MRSRNIKPGFFKNEELAEVDPMARILFIGLWCYADREGRFELRPKKIRAEIFPYENVDIESLLHALSCHGFVITWNDNGNHYGQIVNFSKHQNPHPHEAQSKIPEYNQCHDMSLTLHGMSSTSNADSLIPDSLIPDSNILSESDDSDFIQLKKGRRLKGERLAWFEEFWDSFGYKSGKKPAAQAWYDISPNKELKDKIISAAKAECARRPELKKKGSTPKMAQGWLTDRRFEDEIYQDQKKQAPDPPGYVAAMNGLPCDPPKELPPEDRDQWIEDWKWRKEQERLDIV